MLGGARHTHLCLHHQYHLALIPLFAPLPPPPVQVTLAERNKARTMALAGRGPAGAGGGGGAPAPQLVHVQAVSRSPN